MDQNQIRTIIGVIGNVISFGLFLSPVPTFYKIWKQKDVKQFSPMPYLATLMNCMLWVFYGLPVVHPNSTLVYTINGIGFVIESIYLTIFFIYTNKQTRMKVIKILAAEFLFMIGVIVVVLTTAHSHEKRTQIVGSLCVIFGTCMYAAPLTVMKLVIQTKSVKYMPFLLSLVCFLNGICWTTYAVLPFDIFLVIPNGLGAVFGFIQLLLYACFYRTTNWDEEEPSKTKEVEMPSAV